MEPLKQIISNFPQSFISGILLSGTLITLTYLLVWKKFKKRFHNWRIQIKERVDAKQIKGELKNAIFTSLVGALFSCIVIYLSSKGYTKIYTNFSDHHPAFAIAGFLPKVIAFCKSAFCKLPNSMFTKSVAGFG